MTDAPPSGDKSQDRPWPTLEEALARSREIRAASVALMEKKRHADEASRRGE